MMFALEFDKYWYEQYRSNSNRLEQSSQRTR